MCCDMFLPWLKLVRPSYSVLASSGLHACTCSCESVRARAYSDRFHQYLKSALQARFRTSSWADELPWILLGIRTAPKDELQSSSAELVYGSLLTVPGDFIRTPLDPSSDFQLRQL